MNSDKLTTAYLISSVNTSKSSAVPCRVIALDTNQFTVGRSCDTNFCISSPVISRFHALFVHKNQWTVSDNKSLNGVFVNGIKLEPHEPKPLNEGDNVCFGVITQDEEFSFTFTAKLSNEDATAAKKRRVGVQSGSTSVVEWNTNESDEDQSRDVKRIKPEPVYESAVSYENEIIFPMPNIKKEEASSTAENSDKLHNFINEEKPFKITEKTSEIPNSNTNDKLSRVLKKDLECCICSEVLIKAVVLNCSHSFCLYCIEQWKMKKVECPVCRALITSQTSSVLLDSIVSNLVDTWDQERKQARQQLIQRRTKKMHSTKTNNACKSKLLSR